MNNDNLGKMVKCKFAGNLPDCDKCPHAITHEKRVECMVPRDTCVNVDTYKHEESGNCRPRE
jgi:hypothetical protein